MRSMWRRAIALVLIPLVVTACHTWRVVEMEPKALVETKAPPEIRLTTVDNGRVAIVKPRVVGDSILGRRGGTAVAVALADVTRAETLHLNVAGTVGMALFVGAIVTVFVGYIWCSQHECFSYWGY